LIDNALIRRLFLPRFQIPCKPANLTLDFSWLLVAPASAWTLAEVYLPIVNPGLSTFQSWLTALILLMCIFLSLSFHTLAHIIAARALRCKIPPRIPVHILGDAAQIWPAAPDSGKEAIVSLAGVLAQGFLAAVAYILWNAQLNQLLNSILYFLIFFNLGLLALNLTPAFPFDGGRLIRSIIWRLQGRWDLASRLVFRIGLIFSISLMGWGGFLFSQQTRFSLETGAATFAIALLIVYSLLMYRNLNISGTERTYQTGYRSIVIWSPISGLLFLLLAAITFSLMPMNYGLEAPGFTAPVGPMVQLPQQYSHPSRGSFIISSVILQAPIIAGEWVYGKLDTSVNLVPQEKIVPVTRTVHSVATSNYRMLLDSKTIATVLGLRLAGYTVDIDGSNVQLPFPVEINHQKTFGGPSAGLMFTLGVYDMVTPQDLTGGRKIAGTGTVNMDGKVGAVGGIPQKVVAAERAGAQYFLCPSRNYQAALSYAKRMQVIEVNSAQEAIDFLNSLPPLPAN
jgi:PDZ domain-containing protein